MGPENCIPSKHFRLVLYTLHVKICVLQQGEFPERSDVTTHPSQDLLSCEQTEDEHLFAPPETTVSSTLNRTVGPQHNWVSCKH